MAKAVTLKKSSALTEAKAPFTILVSGELAYDEYKVNDTLSLVRHIADFTRHHFLAAGGDKERLDKISDAVLIEIMSSANVSDKEGDDIVQVYIDAIAASKQMVDTSDIPDVHQLQIAGAAGSIANSAIEYGKQVDKVTETGLAEGLEGKRRAEATPFITEANLVRQFGDMIEPKSKLPVMQTFPPIKSKYRAGTKNPGYAPAGYRLPSDPEGKDKLPVWQGGWNYYRVKNSSNTGPTHRDGHWGSEFTAGTEAGSYWADMVKHIEAALNNAVLDNFAGHPCPDDIKALRQEGNQSKLLSKLSEATDEFTWRRQKYERAIEYWQAKRTISERFPHITVELAGERLFGESLIVSARKKKPCVLVTRIKNDKSEVEVTPSKPQTLSRIMQVAAKAHLYPANTQHGTLLEVKRGRKDETILEGETAKAPKLANINQFHNAMSEVCDYAKADKGSLMLQRTMDKDEGGAFANLLCTTWDALGEVVKVPGVRERSDAWLAEQSEHRATEDKARRDAANKTAAEASGGTTTVQVKVA